MKRISICLLMLSLITGFAYANEVDKLIQVLKGKDKIARKEAADALVKIGTPTVEPLIAVLKDENLRARASAAKALGEIKDTRAVKPLINALKNECSDRHYDGSHSFGRTACRRFVAMSRKALIEIGEPAIEPLINALKDEGSYIRSSKAVTLFDYFWKDASPYVTMCPKFVNPSFKDGHLRYGCHFPISAALVLRRMRGIGLPAVESLIAVLKDKNMYVRRWSAWSLGYIKSDRAVEPLINALKDENVYVRSHAANALGRIKDTRAVEPLIAALKDESVYVREEAANALGRIKDTRAVEPLIVALKDVEAYVRMYSARSLGDMKSARAVDPLIAALKDESVYVRDGAVSALGEIRDTRAVEPLINALKDENEDIRRHAANALEKITGKDFRTNQSK